MSGSEERRLDEVVRRIAALILCQRYRARGVPLSRLKEIAKSYGLPLERCLVEVEKRLAAVGLKLVRVTEKLGDRESEKVLAVVDPTLDLEDVRPYRDEVLAVLAIIYNLESEGRVQIGRVAETLASLTGDTSMARALLERALRRLSEDGVLRVKGDEIILTALGLAMKPPMELIERKLIEYLAGRQK